MNFESILEPKIFSKNALVYFILSELSFLLSAIIFYEPFDSFTGILKYYYLLGILFIALMIYIYFYEKVFKLPRVNIKNNEVLIVFSILFENELQETRFRKDLNNEVTSLLKLDGDFNFKVIFLNNYHSNKISNADDKGKIIRKINKTIGAILYIYGDVSQRGDSGLDNYIIQHDIMLFHSRVSKRQKESLQFLLNNCVFRTKFPLNEETKGFEITANLIYFNIRTLFGIALIFSNHILLAYKIHTDLLDNKSLIPQGNHKKWNIIRNNIELAVYEESDKLFFYYLYKPDLEETKKYIDRIYMLGDEYGAFLMYAMYFYKKSKIQDAFQYIRRAQKKSKGRFEWRYSRAFLYLSDGDYTNFLKDIDLLNRDIYISIYQDEFFEGMEQFTLSDAMYKDKPQFIFWLGYIHNISGNFPYGLKYFTEFLSTIGIEEHPLKHLALTYKTEIDEKLNLKKSGKQ